MNGFTGICVGALHPPLKNGFLLTNKSLAVELWNGFLLFMLLLSSAKEISFKDINFIFT